MKEEMYEEWMIEQEKWLGSMPIYHMSLFKVLMKVLYRMESIRFYFFNGVDHNGIHGEDDKPCKNANHSHPSIWLDIVREMKQLKNHETDLIGFIHKKMGNEVDTSFWEDVWRGDVKTSHENVRYSLRRIPRGGTEHVQFLEFLASILASIEGVALVDMRDMWVWSLDGSRE
nr:hypothetical protein [Tanacetum cinerariifolium]